MDDSVDAEDFREWEQVQIPFPETLPANHPSWEFDAVIVGNNCNVQHRCFSDVFHPSDLLQAHSHRSNSISPSPSPSSSSSSLSTSSGSEDNDEARNRKPWLASSLLAANEFGRHLKLRFGVMSAGVLRLASKVCDYKLSPRGFWAVASMTGMVTVMVALLSLLYTTVLKRWRRSVYHHDKERLIFLLRHKDEVGFPQPPFFFFLLFPYKKKQNTEQKSLSDIHPSPVYLSSYRIIWRIC